MEDIKYIIERLKEIYNIVDLDVEENKEIFRVKIISIKSGFMGNSKKQNNFIIKKPIENVGEVINIMGKEISNGQR